MSQKPCVKAVYSTKEKALLASLVEISKDKLESKKTDGTTNAIKNETWQMIAEQYSTHDVTVRTAGQLKKCWENMKYKTRKSDTHVRHSMLLTGGGPPEKDASDVLDDMVRAIVPTINYTLTNVWDSSGIVESDQMVTLNSQGTISTNDVQKVCCNKILENLPVSVENPKLISENKPNTPEQSGNETKVKADKNRSAPKSTLKRKRLSSLEEEKELRIRKLQESLEQQKELHALKMEAVEAEKLYWIARKQLLSTE